ncbi:PIN domain-like protein [Tricholoma matsutake]|nr:PIN domain-like protein [Tricholoma matsutake 945]
MGVPGLWKILQPAAQTCSLTEVATVKGYAQDHHRSQTMVVGIDASIWMKRALAQFHHPQHAQAGENPELCTLFYQLCHLLRHTIMAVFVSDGPQWATYKHNQLVITQPIWITQLFQAFIATFGFHSHTAPGEAKAELAYLNHTKLIDAVLTDDGDTFIFGASRVIQNFDIKKDGDTVMIFTEMAIQTKQEIRLMQGGMLLMALLGGGDYDTVGLSGCGAATTFKLLLTDIGDSLLHAAQQLLAQELAGFLILWRNELQNELSTDRSGFLGHCFPGLANSVHNNFPALRVIYQYTKPATSWSNGGDGPDTSAWLPQQPHLSELTALCERTFSWSSVIINNSFCKNVWDGCCVRRLAQITKILPLLVPSSQQAPRMDVGISAHSSGTQAHNEEPASEDSIPEQDVLDRMVVDTNAAHTEPASNPDFIDLTLGD